MGDSILTYDDIDKKLDKKEINKYALMSYVDDTVVFKKLSSIIELNSGKKIINVEKFEDNKVYYFINDINTSTTTLVSISLYKNNEKVNTMVIYPNDRFITMGYKSSTNEFFSFSDMESVKYNVVNKTREYNNSRSVTKKADSDQVLTKTNTTAFTPTADYHPTTKKYVDGKVAGIVNSAPETLDTLQELATALGNDPNFATTISTQIGKKVNKADGMTLTHNDLTNKLIMTLLIIIAKLNIVIMI